MAITPDVTFVCCVESGSLETQTVRMIESLRRWGGTFANAPVFAVTPRFGLPLAYQTHKTFERLEVQYLRFHAETPYSWYNLLNKPYSLVAVENRSTSEFIGWLDSDLLFVGEPNELILGEGEDFVACAPDKNIGTEGSGDLFENFWEEVCQLVGIDIKDLPWITVHREKKRIRLYWNSGVFVYRRSTGLAQQYKEICTRLLDARITSKATNNIFFHEQMSLGLAMFKRQLSWRALSHSHNYDWVRGKKHTKYYNAEDAKSAKIIHAHGILWPEFWPIFIQCLYQTHPLVAEWIEPLGPLRNDIPFYWKIIGKVIQNIRSQQRLAYVKSCRVI